jgi:hypothetical protein
VTYEETTKALWALIGEDVQISVSIDNPAFPTAGPVASFAVHLRETLEWMGKGWRVLDARLPEGEKDVIGAGHMSASLSQYDFIEGKLTHNGDGVEATFRGGVHVLVVKRQPGGRVYDAEGRVFDASDLSP